MDSRPDVFNTHCSYSKTTLPWRLVYGGKARTVADNAKAQSDTKLWVAHVRTHAQTDKRTCPIKASFVKQKITSSAYPSLFRWVFLPFTSTHPIIPVCALHKPLNSSSVSIFNSHPQTRVISAQARTLYISTTVGN